VTVRPKTRHFAATWSARRVVWIASCASTLAGVGHARADVAACIASSEQGLALRRAGRLQEARRQLASCTVPGCPEELRTECVKRIDAINAALPTLVVGAKDPGGNDVHAATVTIDGTLAAATLDGRPIAVDPGEHTVRVTAPGLPSAERRLVLGEGDKARHEAFILGAAEARARPAIPEAALETSPTAGGTQRTLAVVGGGLGVAAVGLGATFGLLASSEWSSAQAAVKAQASCASAAACPAHSQALNDHDTASTYATASTIAFGVGAALVVTGIVTWLTAPARAPAGQAHTTSVHVTPSSERGGAGLAVFGDF